MTQLMINRIIDLLHCNRSWSCIKISGIVDGWINNKLKSQLLICCNYTIVHLACNTCYICFVFALVLWRACCCSCLGNGSTRRSSAYSGLIGNWYLLCSCCLNSCCDLGCNNFLFGFLGVFRCCFGNNGCLGIYCCITGFICFIGYFCFGFQFLGVALLGSLF